MSPKQKTSNVTNAPDGTNTKLMFSSTLPANRNHIQYQDDLSQKASIRFHFLRKTKRKWTSEKFILIDQISLK